MFSVSNPPRRVGRFRHFVQLLASHKRNDLVLHAMDVEDGTLGVDRNQNADRNEGNFGTVVVGIFSAQKTASDESRRTRVDGGLQNDAADGNRSLLVN